MKYLNYLTAVLLALVISAQVNANCVRVNPVDQGCDACGASLNLGNIGLMNVNYQPVGTVLARSVFGWFQQYVTVIRSVYFISAT